MELRFRVDGVPEANDALARFEMAVRRRMLSRAIKAGAKPFLDAARLYSPRRMGIFRRALTIVTRTYSDSGTIVAVIGQKKGGTRRKAKGGGGISGRGDLIPIHLVEYPTKGHTLERQSKARTLQGLKRFLRKHSKQPTAATVVAKLPQGFRRLRLDRRHPGTRGARFMKRAADAQGANALNQFSNTLQSEIERG